MLKMISMGISTGLIMMLLAGRFVFKTHHELYVLKPSFEEKKAEFDKNQEYLLNVFGEKKLGNVLFSFSGAWFFLTLMLVICVLSHFQGYVTLILSLVAIGLTGRLMLKVWDKRKRILEHEYKKTTKKSYIQYVVLCGIYTCFTLQLILSLFN